jgi:predicted NAD/FAD-dependent oxidoreductase
MAASKRSITVVGGGLAGIVAALRLLECGCEVDLYEADIRLGGKAGANASASGHEDHGYHIFPMWYVNVWKLVKEMDIDSHFVDRTDFIQLKPHEFPRAAKLTNISSTKYAWRNLTSGVLPFLEMALLYYFGLDLMAAPLSQKAFLDQITVNGFIRARFYRTEALARQCQDLILKGISTPSYFASAMTMRTVLKNWAKYPEPMCRVLNRNLQDGFIDPLVVRLRSLGCNVHLEHRLDKVKVRNGAVERLCFRDVNSNATREVDVDTVLLAIPAERVCALLDEELYEAEPSLAALFNLHTCPMAALNIYLRSSIPDLPSAHVNLLDSQYGLSFIDVSQIWPGFSATVLNIIASDVSDLATLPPAVGQREIVADLRRFLPGLEDDNIERMDFQQHVNAPLLTNEVGMWSSRPSATTAVPNLFLAGDYCKTHIDLVCMEGAVSAGLYAAEAIRKHVAAPGTIEVRIPSTHPRWIWWLAKFLLMPFAAVAKVLLMIAAPERMQSRTPQTVKRRGGEER